MNRQARDGRRGVRHVPKLPQRAHKLSDPRFFAAADIRAAAARAAASRAEGSVRPGGESSSGAGNVTSSNDGGQYEYMDEEAMLNMPKMLADMAEGMLVSPPRGPASNDSPENSDGESLWSY